MKTFWKSALCLVTAMSFVACSSTTLIRSTDPEAKIYVNGEFKGKGSYQHSDTAIVGSSVAVRLEKDGCPSQSYNFSRSEKFSPGACAGGVFLLFPFLWIMGYNDEHVYEMSCPSPKKEEAADDEAEVKKPAKKSKKQ